MRDGWLMRVGELLEPAVAAMRKDLPHAGFCTSTRRRLDRRSWLKSRTSHPDVGMLPENDPIPANSSVYDLPLIRWTTKEITAMINRR
jgi:hypothetical protein